MATKKNKSKTSKKNKITKCTKTRNELEQIVKEWFLAPHPDDSRKHAYTRIEITKKLRKNYGFEITEGGIRNWIKKNEWDVMWESGQRLGVEEILKQKQQQESNDEAYTNAIANERVERHKIIDSQFKKSAMLIDAILDQELAVLEQTKGNGRPYIPGKNIWMFLQNNYNHLNKSIAEDEKQTDGHKNATFHVIIPEPVTAESIK